MSIFAISIVGLIIAFLSQKVRQLILFGLSRMMGLIIRKTYLHRSLGDAFISYMSSSGFKNKKFAGELYGEDVAFIRSENEVKHILYRDFHSNTQVFYGKGWPVLVSGMPLIQDPNKSKNFAYVVYTFRWSVDLIKFLDNATETKNEKIVDDTPVSNFVVKRVSGGRFFKEKTDAQSGRSNEPRPVAISEETLADPFSSFIPVKWEKSNIGQVVYHNIMDMMSLNQELEDLLEEVQFWFSAQEWYEERGIPWKRGLLFYGHPGTGKSLFTRALAEKLGVPLLIFDLTSMNNTEFVDAWSQLLPKRIALFEDFDAVFHGRENIIHSELSFDCILNVLDGADKKQGILTIITTNHPETLDYALGGAMEKAKDGKLVMPKRPGRIDRSVEFLPLDHKGKMKLAMRIMKDEKLAEKIVEEGVNDSAAQIQERAFRAAIGMLFDTADKKALIEKMKIKTKNNPTNDNDVFAVPITREEGD